MAKYVLVAFEDDEEADNFAEALERCAAQIGAGEPGGHVFWSVSHSSVASQYVVVSPRSETKVAGAFKRPTKFCECPNPGEKSVRGTKWGWWVHKDCGKPKRGNWQSPRNLLEAENTHPRDKTLFISVVEGADRPHYLPKVMS